MVYIRLIIWWLVLCGISLLRDVIDEKTSVSPSETAQICERDSLGNTRHANSIRFRKYAELQIGRY